MAGAVHDFRERLDWSERGGDEPFWDAVYRKAFPNLVNHMPTPGDVASQRQGIDRLLFLANSKTIYIDEKKRGKEYGDILLEYVSVDRTNAPGWIEKDLSIDFLSYAFMSSGRCYLFPWPLLRLAWSQNRDRWKREYRPVVARNRDYNTLSLPVPILVLQRAVAKSLIIDVLPHERQQATARVISEENRHIAETFNGAPADPDMAAINDYEARQWDWLEDGEK